MNLTTIVEPQEATVKHMLDSLVLTKLGRSFSPAQPSMWVPELGSPGSR